MRLLSSLVLLTLVALAAPRAQAQEKAQQKRIKLEGFSVDGTVQKPQAFYVLPRASLNYQPVERPVSFLPKIKKSLQKDPF